MLQAKRSIPDHFYTLSVSRTARDILMLWGMVFLGVWLFSVSNSVGVTVISIIGIGLIQNAFGILAHDAIHFRLHPQKVINDCIAALCVTSFLTLPLSSVRKNHLNHHRHLGTPLDYDRHYHVTEDKRTPFSFLRFLLSSLLFVSLFKIALKLLFGHQSSSASTTPSKTASPVKKEESVLSFYSEVAMVIVAQAILFVLFWQLSGQFYTYFLLWLLPLYTISVFLNCVRSFSEHAIPVDDAIADKNRLITHECPFWEAAVFSPLNMNYHAEHHLYIAVPYYHLPALNRYLHDHHQPDIDYRKSYIASLWAFWQYTLKRQSASKKSLVSG